MSGARRKECTTSRAVKGEPSWNRTPWRSSMSQTNGSTPTCHDTASPGRSDMSGATSTSESKMCWRTTTLVPISAKWGSIEVVSVEIPIRSVPAQPGATPRRRTSSSANRDIETIGSPFARE
jgi:hypothetical protein